jgi:hypothetical protein
MATTSYADNINFFGSPEAYANAIKSKLSSGQQLTDPAGAQAFMKDYPQFFNNSSNTNKSSTALIPARKTFESSGYNVTYNPDSETVTVANPINPYTYSYTFKPTTIENGVSYIDPQTVQIAQAKLTPPYQNTYNELSSMASGLINQISGLANGYMQNMNNYMKQYSDAGIAMLKAYQDQYSQALGQLQQLMQPQKDVPDSVKLAVQLLKEQVDDNLKALDEDMIRRGVYRSGIAAEEAQKLRKGQLDNEQQILAQWLDQQHQQMYNAALEYAKMQANYAGNYATMYQQAVMQPLQMGMSVAKNAYDMQSQLAQKAYDLSAGLRQWYDQQRLEDMRYKTQEDIALQKENAQSQQKLLELAWDKYKWENPSAYQQAQLGLQNNRYNLDAAYKSAEIAKINADVSANAATKSAIADILSSSPDFNSAITKLQQNSKAYAAAGADLNKVVNSIYAGFASTASASANQAPLADSAPQTGLTWDSIINGLKSGWQALTNP